VLEERAHSFKTYCNIDHYQRSYDKKVGGHFGLYYEGEKQKDERDVAQQSVVDGFIFFVLKKG
jgi:hypothetical protein